MDKSLIDQIVEYPAKVIHKLGTDQTLVSLLTNTPDIDMSSDEADEVFDKCLYDYGYVDDSATESQAYICVEAEAIKSPTAAVQNMKLYVTVVCHKHFMSIDPAKFPGMIGNRRDNIVRYTDRLLSRSDIFGIGALKLESIKTMSAPVGYTARELTYSVSDFKSKSFS